MTEHEKSGDGVRAVGRALDVLLAFSAESKDLSAGELAQRVNLSRPTLYRLLYTLEARGFISSFGEPQRFKLGPAIARVAQAWTLEQDVARIADPVLRQLWADTQETVALWIRQGDIRYCLVELPSPQALNFKRGVGSTERIARGASGRAILAFSGIPDAEVKALATSANMSATRFREELHSTRALGYATSRDELIVGAVAVAAPISDASGVIGSIGVYGPAVRLGEKDVAKLGKTVLRRAAEVSTLLGCASA